MVIRHVHDVLGRAKNVSLKLHSKLSGPRMCASTCVAPKGGEGHAMATCRITESTIPKGCVDSVMDEGIRELLDPSEKKKIGVGSWITINFRPTLA